MNATVPYTYKSHFLGTHRACTPEVTWNRIEPWLERFGVTRIAPVTGLDNVGISTVMAIRPASRGLSVAQGKGIDEPSARVSGAMEAIEHAVAESVINDRLYGSVREIETRYCMPHMNRLASCSSKFTNDIELLWVNGVDLVTATNTLCPYELVHLDLSLRATPGAEYFEVTSNGLASGNSLIEATCHGLFEVVERDALCKFFALAGAEQESRRVALDSVDDSTCRELLSRYSAAGVDVAIWDINSIIGLPVFMCDIVDGPAQAMRGLQRARGSGCHSSRGIALTRALCEAAQARLTYIAGSRDDIVPDELHRAREPNAIHRARQEIARIGTSKFERTPDLSFDSFDAELAWILERLDACGYQQVLRVVLRDEPDEPFAVTRIVVPGLGFSTSHNRQGCGS